MSRRLSTLAALCAFAVISPAASADAGYRITGGQPTVDGDAPWIASVIVQGDDGERYVCGGSLIAPSAVLTAAHCADPATYVEQFRVVVGKRRFQPSGGIPASGVTVDQAHSPAVFDASSDVAVIFLSEEVYAPTLRLATARPQVGEPVTLYGWGATDRVLDHQRFPTQLRKARLRVLRNRTCVTRLRLPFAPGEVCAGDERARRDACTGDSGGPLVRWRGKIPYQLGIVSYGDRMCRASTGAYGSVPFNRSFINRIVAEGPAAATGENLRRLARR